MSPKVTRQDYSFCPCPDKTLTDTTDTKDTNMGNTDRKKCTEQKYYMKTESGQNNKRDGLKNV